MFVGLESDIAALEHRVNAWLAENNARIVNIFGNIAPQTTNGDPGGKVSRRFESSDVLMTIVYEKA